MSRTRYVFRLYTSAPCTACGATLSFDGQDQTPTGVCPSCGALVRREGELVEMGADWTGAPLRAQTPTEELLYGGVRATDGADISSKRKLREYFHRTGFTHASDFTQQWECQAAEREKARTPGSGYGSRERRETIGRVAYELERKGRKL